MKSAKFKIGDLVVYSIETQPYIYRIVDVGEDFYYVKEQRGPFEDAIDKGWLETRFRLLTKLEKALK